LIEPESDLDEAFIERHELALEKAQREKNEKLLIKENEKRMENGEKPLLSLPEKKKTTTPMIEKLEKKLQNLNDRISSQKLQLVDKVSNY
jgi:predicted nuclease with TOPRIM domain